MLIVPIEEAKPGMKLAAPVAHPVQHDQILLKSGYILEAEVLLRLRDLGTTILFVDYPGLEDLDRHLAVYLSPDRQQMFRQIKQAIAASEQSTRPTVPYADYYATTRGMITTLLTQGRNPVYLDLMGRLGNAEIAHATAVAHLALVVGIRLQQYLISERQRLPMKRAAEVINLGVGGMLHDLGKARLPVELRSYNELSQPHSPVELAEWQRHVKYGYDMIHDGVEATAAAAVLHHHQRWDGGGFPLVRGDAKPAGMEGKRAHVFARIIHAANLYDRLSVLPDGSRRTNIQVHHLLKMAHGASIDPEIRSALLLAAPPYPPGEKVTLADGCRAIVTRVDAADPFYPIVRKISSDGWEMLGPPIDLKGPKAPEIVAIGNTRVQTLVEELTAIA